MFSWKEALIFAVQQVRGPPKSPGSSSSASSGSPISSSALSLSVQAVGYGSSVLSKSGPPPASHSLHNQFQKPQSVPQQQHQYQPSSLPSQPVLQHSNSQPNFSRPQQQQPVHPVQPVHYQPAQVTQYQQKSSTPPSYQQQTQAYSQAFQQPVLGATPPSPSATRQAVAQTPPSPRAQQLNQTPAIQVTQPQIALSQSPPQQTGNISPSSSPLNSPSSAYWSRYLQEEAIRVTVDDFEILAVVGVGSYGTVAQVRHKKSGQIYALKVLNKKDIIQRSEESHTKAEKIILASINHPFLMNLHYSFQTPDKLFFVMDFVNGGEMFYHLQREQNFDLGRTRFYAAEIFMGLEYLHSRGIIYRCVQHLLHHPESDDLTHYVRF
jgi:hypothetical protein